MGKFDLDDILSEVVGDPGLASDDADTTQSGSATIPAVEPAPLFVRNDPRETPRPPDLASSGLNEEIEVERAFAKASPVRVRPDDALTQLYTPAEMQPLGATDLAEQLLERGIVSAEQVASAARIRKQTPDKPLGEILLEMGVDERAIQAIVADRARLTFERIDADQATPYDERSLNRLGVDYCTKNMILPLRREGSRFVVGTTNPDDVFLLDDIKRKLGVVSIKHVLLAPNDIKNTLEKLQEKETDDYDVRDILADVDADDVELVAESIDEADIADAESSPVVRYVNHIIQSAVKEGASDIHIEPEEKSLKVRFRIDGILFEMMSPPKKMHQALTSRIKIMANLDIAERRLPQDGRIRAQVLGRKLDLRVSTVPTPKGEKTVMRILDDRSIQVTLDELGFTEDTLMIWKNQISQPHGILLVTGPTGSGKTTTLYSSIRQMDIRKLNISTVEDPVEYNLAGITQMQTHEKIGMTFARALKALLRQDPDVIMLGEIRDMETATTAIQAALTGHLVLSTLHTNDAPSSITRLINIGVESFLVGASVNAVLAQRLVRRICQACGEDVTPTEERKDFMEMHGIARTTLRHGRGCKNCRETGYNGRVGLYELLVLDDHLRDSIARSPNVTEFRRMCTERGMRTLREDGFIKVTSGQTSIEEVLRVTEATI